MAQLFWGLDNEKMPSSAKDLYELTQQNRSQDLWLQAMLAQDRVGQESFTVWCFTHGLPTSKVGSWLPTASMPMCGSTQCNALQNTVWPEAMKQRIPWAQRKQEECSICQQERDRRCIVLGCGSKEDKSAVVAAFAGAAYVHPYNQPKYHAQILRAVNYAKLENKKVLWCLAEDWPLTAAEEDLSLDAVGRLQEHWLQRHDRDTAGIMGMFPMVQDLPVRLSDHQDRKGGAFKHTRGFLRKWELPPSEEARIANIDDNEIELAVQPLALHIELPTATPHLQTPLAPKMLRMTPKTKVWCRDNADNAKVRRKGFEVVPDFGGTAHAYCGDSMDQAQGDLLEWDRYPNLDAQLRGYTIKARVRDTSGLLIVQPYSPALFAQGVQPGPDLLLRRQRGELTEKQLQAAWQKITDGEEEAAQHKDWPWAMPLPCRRCSLEAGKEVLKPLELFSGRGRSRTDIWNKILSQGEDLHCIRCRQIIFKDAVGTKGIPCDGCQHEVRRKDFEQEQLDLWDAKEPGNYVCRKCQGTLGGTRMEDREVFECTNCRTKWTDCHFLDESIAAWKAKSKASLWCAQGHEETPIVYKC